MTNFSATGNLRKMRTTHLDTVQYQLPIGESLIPMNEALGAPVKIEFGGQINCIACGRSTKKSFQQGHCFPCMRSLPQCDTCIVRPETCHFHEGTCRDAEWGQKNCMQDHYLYLANSSGLKVGITRGTQIPTRWMDQGAVQALPIIRTKSRYEIGQLEVALKNYVNDRTNWQRMLKGEPEPLDLPHLATQLYEQAAAELAALEFDWWRLDEGVRDFNYPVTTYPEKVKSFNLDKTPCVGGVLQGIKGQYLIFDTGVINMRKYGGYAVEIRVG